MFEEIKIDTFSSNSLKVLDRSLEEFKNKYVYNLTLYKKDQRAVLGQKFHSLICSYINGFDVSNMLEDLNEEEYNYWVNLEKKLREKINEKNSKFIKTEYSFLVKDKIKDKNFYLTGRFDAIWKNEQDDSYIIYDWKTLNFPKDAENDLQSVVYLYCMNKIFNTKNVKVRYFSIEKLNYLDVIFKDERQYQKRIQDIISKLYNCL